MEVFDSMVELRSDNPSITGDHVRGFVGSYAIVASLSATRMAVDDANVSSQCDWF